MLIEAVTYRWLTAVQKLLGSRNMEDYIKSVDWFELVSRSSVAVISREDVGSLQTSNFRFFRMQKELLSNEFNQSGCIQNDPVLHKLFEDAIAVLRLAGADDNSVGKN